MEGGGGAKTQTEMVGGKESCMPNGGGGGGGGGHNCVKVCVWDEKWDLEEEQVGTIEMSQKEIRYLSKSIQ